jgi:hypothetical protein
MPKKYMHTFFTGDKLPDKVIVALQSALRLQNDAKILLWTTETMVELLKQQLAPIQSRFCCASRATLEVHSLGELKQKLIDSLHPVVNSRRCDLSVASANLTQYSDLFRFIVLFFYGGIYFDADTLFLKDMAPWFELANYGFAFKWGGEGVDVNPNDPVTNGFNTAVMGLPKGSSVPARLINAVQGRCDAETFYPSRIGPRLGCEERDSFCEGLVMVPSSAFDPIHQPNRVEKWKGISESFNQWAMSGDGMYDEEPV